MNKKLQRGTPIAINVEINKPEKTMLVLIENEIFDFKLFVFFSSPLSILFDCSLIDGMIVTASEPINVDGTIMSGNVIPIIIPNSDNASVDE